jgi:uncharacterized protein (DUF2252 family)
MATTHPTQLGQLQDDREAARCACRRTADAYRATLRFGAGSLDAHQLALLAAHTAAYRQWLDAHEAIKAHQLVAASTQQPEVRSTEGERSEETQRQQLTSAEIGERNRRLMFGDNDEAFPSREEWRRITD